MKQEVLSKIFLRQELVCLQRRCESLGVRFVVERFVENARRYGTGKVACMAHRILDMYSYIEYINKLKSQLKE